MKSTRLGALILAAFGAAAVALHVAAGTTFPVPWVDEIDFLAPAAALAKHGSLHVPQLSAPAGMYWVSDAYYVLLAPALKLFGTTVTTGRAVSLVAVLLAGVGFWTAARKAGGHAVAAAVAVGIWLVTPRVVIAGNITRHEAVVLACVAWALAAALSGRRTAALTAATLAVVVHPAGAPLAAVVAVAALVRPARRTERWEWVLVAALGVFLAFEVVHFAVNWSVAREQIEFQLHRKAGRSTPARDAVFVVGTVAALAASWRLRRTPWHGAVVFAGLACAGGVVTSYGGEMWYGVYGFCTAAMLLAVAALAVLPHLDVQSRLLAHAAVVATAGVAVFATQGYNAGFFGMRVNADKSEWRAFVADVRGDLLALDARTTKPTTVAVNALSGLPWPLEGERFGDVTVVKETTVSRAPQADYVLYARTFCCSGNIPPAGDLGTVVDAASSPHGVFDATLFKTRSVGAD